MDFSITKFGKKVKKSLYTWDKNTKTLTTDENGLVLYFSGINRVTFKTGFNCTFNTGHNCVFNTGHGCTFNTGYGCTFNTGSGCTFDTVYDCIFNTNHSCIFKTGSGCTFDTTRECVIIRKDIYEVIEIPHDTKIKLNGHKTKGYIIREIIEVRGKKYYENEVIERLRGLKPIK